MQRYLVPALLGMTLLGTQASAQSDLYLGVDFMQSYNTVEMDDTGYDTFDFDDDSRGFKFKLGFLTYDGWRVQGYYLNETFDDPIFDLNNDQLSEMGIDLIKSFGGGGSLGIAPFIQGGIGVGWMDLDPAYYYDDSISEYSLKLGAGLLFWLSPSIDAVAGIDVQYRGWDDIRYWNDATSQHEYLETEDTSTRFYLGLNVYF